MRDSRSESTVVRSVGVPVGALLQITHWALVPSSNQMKSWAEFGSNQRLPAAGVAGGSAPRKIEALDVPAVAITHCALVPSSYQTNNSAESGSNQRSPGVAPTGAVELV